MIKVLLRRVFGIVFGLLALTISIVLLPPLLRIPSYDKQVDRSYSLSALPADWLARQLMVAFNAPGMTVAVAMDGKIVWSEGFGYANLSDHVPACPQTLFRIGSVSKSLTGVAIANLYGQGKLDLDAPVQDYV